MHAIHGNKATVHSRALRPISRFILLALNCLVIACSTTSQQTSPAQSTTQNNDTIGSTSIEPTVVSTPEYNDPLIGFNRAVFDFNDVAYRYVLVPFSEGYIAVVPDPVRGGISNFFTNIKMPISFVNNLLQGKPGDSARNVARFGINSTLGILGFFDPAEDWFELAPAQNNLNTTLSSWGAGYGFYLVLPILGPSDLRNTLARFGDQALNPVNYLSEEQDQIILQGVDNINAFAPQAQRYLDLKAEAEDPYLFFRNMYLQGVVRDAEYSDQQ